MAEIRNRDLIKEVAKASPLFGSIRWDIPGGQITTELSAHNHQVAEYATKEKFRTLDSKASAMYKDPDQIYIADQVAPFFPRPDLIGSYRKIDEKTFYTRPKVGAAKNTPPNRIDWGDSLVNYDLTGRALSIYLSRIDLDQAKTQYGSEQRYRELARMFLTRLLVLDREITVASLYQTTGNFDAGFTATASPLWSSSSATILGDMATAEDALLAPRDMTIIAHNVYREMQKNTLITGASTVSGSKRQELQTYVNKEAIENYLDSSVIVGSARYDSSPKTPATLTMSRIWEDYVTVCHLSSDPSSEIASPCVRTFILDSNVVPNYQGWSVKVVPDDSTLAGGELMMLGYFAQEKVFAQKNMYSIKAL